MKLKDTQKPFNIKVLYSKFKSKLGLTRRVPLRSKNKSEFGHRIGRRTGSKYSTPKWKVYLGRAGIFMSLSILFMFLFGILALLGLISAYSRDLPNIDKYFEESRQLGKETVIYDRNGIELYRLRGDVVNERLSINEVPDRLQWAFLAAEDANFRSHKGLDMFGLARAFICVATNYLQKQSTDNCPGGSSITQQLIKKTTSQEERTFERKVREMILAMRVEEEYSKDEILEFYLNIVPEGREYVGAKTGAIYIFGKSNLNDLTLAEMAYLAAIPNNPEVYSPRGVIYSPELSQKRAAYVLDRMYEERKKTGVTEEEINEAKSQLATVQFASDQINMKAPHFVNQVISVLDKEYQDRVPEGKKGSDYFRNKGYKIITTVDLPTQELMEKTIKERVESQAFQDQSGAQTAAGVVMDNKTGEVLAMVGSRDFYWTGPTDKRFAPKFNSATAPRSMGSSVKPILYMTGFVNGANPLSIVPDLPLDQRSEGSTKPYIPKNYSGVFGALTDPRTGSNHFISIRHGLRNSLNQPAVSMASMVGVDAYADMYVKLTGNESLRASFVGTSSALGAANIPLIEQVHAYNTIADSGIYKPIKYILEIQDEQGNVIVNNREVRSTRVLEAKYAHLITNLNEDYFIFPTSKTVQEIRKTTDFAGKTGTSDTSTAAGDIVFVGYTPDVTVGMWAGNSCGPEECPLKPSASSEYFFEYVFGPFMTEYVKKLPPSRFKNNEEGVRTVQICSITGNAASEACIAAGGRIVQDIVADSALPKEEFMIEKVTVTQCGDSIKLARDIDRDAGLAVDKYYVRYDKLFSRKFISDQLYAYITNGLTVNGRVWRSPNPMPTETCNISRNLAPPQVTLNSPVNGGVYSQSETLNINATVVSDIQLSKVEIALDGVIQKSFAPGEAVQLSLPLNSVSIGNHTITIIATNIRGTESRAESAFSIVAQGPAVIITSPVSNTSISKASTGQFIQLFAKVVGVNQAQIQSAQFQILSGGNVIDTIVANPSGGNYTGSWATPAADSNKTYTIQIVASTTSNGQLSNSVTNIKVIN